MASAAGEGVYEAGGVCFRRGAVAAGGEEKTGGDRSAAGNLLPGDGRLPARLLLRLLAAKIVFFTRRRLPLKRKAFHEKRLLSFSMPAPI